MYLKVNIIPDLKTKHWYICCSLKVDEPVTLILSE